MALDKTATGARARQAGHTRQQLVEAGLRLAERTGLAGMSVNLLVVEAGVAKGTFFHHFGDRAGFLLALHGEFHDRLFAEITEATAHLAAGRDRLLAASTTYLDGCLRQRGIRALLLEARAEPLIAQAVLDRNELAADVLQADFAALRWPHPRQAAHLWIGLVVEAALVELRAGRHQPQVRNTLAHFLGRPALREVAERGHVRRG